MIEELLVMIEAHPASKHGVFKKLAERKLPPRDLCAYLEEMGAFCAASRPAGKMAKLLTRNGFVSEAKLVEEIFQSEAGHGTSYAQMARRLLKGSGYVAYNWQHFDHRVISKETRLAVWLFQNRDRETLAGTMYSLGVMLPLELAVHRQIIPGEVDAFVKRGYYGVALNDLAYLAEHAGDSGAEHQHEDTIVKLLRGIRVTTNQKAEIVRGCREFLDALQGFYDALERIITLT